MRRVVAVMALAVSSLAHAQNAGLDALLKQVREGQAQSARISQEREQRFLRNKNEQAGLVEQAERELATVKSRADAARARFDAQQREIAALKAQLQQRAGDYIQVNAAVRQLAGELRGTAADSLITAQFPERMAFLDGLAASRDLPSLVELEELWFTLTQQMAESGKVVRFPAEIVDEQGARRQAEVIRVGSFTAFADGQYLTTSSGGRLLAALPRQPASGLQRIARKFAASTDAVAPVLVDPSRGSLLLIEGEKPTLGERIRQGGLVGYVIIAIGVVGVLIALGQMVYLERVGRRMRAQLRNLRVPSADNPLGRVLRVFSDDPAHRDDDPELLELRLSEAVLREVPPLERAQSILRLFAAAAPLLGLLGTVTGMIVTFQTITVFGTGDPKLMADGISQALVTTVEGLVVAIPILFINALLGTRSRALVQILDEQSAGLLAQRLEAQRA
ncbi:MotA/TolQ/ExbB proton channel family protein [Fontimonas sp. SYSU GA230001]|uniref:MotA/TolQ/ExbB proton channel family protein n=1 Tax=Fontimonas sp. SYSU GA230001 TaxID=3142450 RepID=UPI0032B3B71A